MPSIHEELGAQAWDSGGKIPISEGISPKGTNFIYIFPTLLWPIFKVFLK